MKASNLPSKRVKMEYNLSFKNLVRHDTFGRSYTQTYVTCKLEEGKKEVP